MIIKIVQWHEIIDSIGIHFPLRVQKKEWAYGWWVMYYMYAQMGLKSLDYFS